MMRSLFSGVAGLRTHQIKMDVIGNNIANVNTTAYKSQSTTFRDLMYQTTQAASGANAETGVGGINAKQIGLGVQVGSINTNIKGQGSAQNTGNAFDIMITGEAFFIVNNGLENFFTRDGSFYVDGAGNLAMTSSGYNVMGWQVDPETGNPKKDTVSPLQIMNDANMTYDAAATTDGRVSGILDRNDTQVNSSSGRIMNLEFYDKKGYLYTAKFSIHSAGQTGRYYVSLDDILDSGTGKSIGPDMLGLVTFGSKTMEVDCSISKSCSTTPTLAGTVAFSSATGVTVPTITPTIGAELVAGAGGLAADVAAVYGINATDAATITNASINAKGQLVITGPANQVGTKAPIAGVTVTPNITSAAVTVGGTTHTAGVGKYTFDPATGTITATAGQTPAPTPVPTAADISVMYNGLNLGTEGVKEFTIEQDGTLTITKKDVQNSANLIYDVGTGLFDSVGGNNEGLITLGLAGAGDMFEDISINFSNTKNVNNGGSSTVGAAKGTAKGLGTGRKIGDMIGISIAKNGIITASYDNGMSRCLGQIATATFANASGLEKQGDNLYSATMNSGEFDGIGEDIEAGGGYMQSGVLEMSNVDLSQEFTEMITTQRGFQANSRIITVSDTMLEELTNLKR